MLFEKSSRRDLVNARNWVFLNRSKSWLINALSSTAKEPNGMCCSPCRLKDFNSGL